MKCISPIKCWSRRLLFVKLKIFSAATEILPLTKHIFFYPSVTNYAVTHLTNTIIYILDGKSKRFGIYNCHTRAQIKREGGGVLIYSN